MVASIGIVISVFPHSSVKAAGASAPMFVAAPIRLSGSLRYSVSTLFPVTAPPPTSGTLQIIEATLMARTRAYIWQPWFIQLSARLGGAVTRSMAEKNSNGLDATGRGDFNFLPRSRYPFHAYIEQQTQSPDDALFGIERLITRYGVDQTYITRRGGLYLATYDAFIVNNRASLANQNAYDTFSDKATLETFMRRPGNDLRLRGNYRREVQNEIGAKHWGKNISATHRFQPSRSFDLSTLVSYDHSIDKKGISYLSSKYSQVSSGFFWRPFEKPWSLFGTVVGRQAKSGGKSTNTASASIGGSSWVKHSANWRSQIGANAAKSKDSKGVFNQRINSSYNDRTRFLGFGYSWHLNGGVTNRMREGDNAQSYRASVGHGINRYVPILGGRGSFSINQTLSESYGTFDRVMATALKHSASIGWSTSTPMSSTQMTLTGSANNSWGSAGRNGTAQLINLQFSRRQSLTRYSRLSANITGQGSRYSTLLEGSEGFRSSLLGYLNYYHTRLFNVPNLRMTSTLSIGSKSFSPSTRLPSKFDLETWDTRVDYFFGKITSSLLLRISGAEGDYYGSVTWTVARRFG